MNRRNFIVQFFIWIFSFVFGYKIGKAQSSDSNVVMDGQDGISNDEKIKLLKDRLADIAINVKDFGHLKVSISQGYDWTPAIVAARNKAESLGVKLKIPAGLYYISKPIDISGIAIEGDETSGFNTSSMGTRIICLKKDFSAFTQKSTSPKNITFSIKNLIIQDALIGLETSYCLNSSFENLFFDNCDLAIKHGDQNKLGGIFNTFENIYTQGCNKGIEINGKSWVNNNVFINCYFSGKSYAASIDCNGGIGAVNNNFISCEFRSNSGFGIRLGSVKSTKFESCYFETVAAAIFITKYQEATTIKGGVFGSLRNDNPLGHKGFIVASSSAGGSIFIDAPYIYLPIKKVNNVEVTAHLSFIDVTEVTEMYKNVKWINEPILEGSPTNFTPMKDINNYNVPKSTSYIIENKNSPHLIMKNDDEDYGFDLYRKRENGSKGNGVIAKLNNNIVFSVDEKGYFSVNKSLGLSPTTPNGVPNNSIFIDSSTNMLKFKDHTGKVKSVTLS